MLILIIIIIIYTLGGCFFNKTNNVCKTVFENLGPIGTQSEI